MYLNRMVNSFVLPPHNSRSPKCCAAQKSWPTAFIAAPLILLLTLLLFVASEARAQALHTELWTGTFTQSAPLPWKGPLYLLIQFDPEADYPQQGKAYASWPSLENAMVECELQMTSERKIRLKESRCVSGGCQMKVLGGEFKGEINSQRQKLSGTATGPFGLNGKFELTRRPRP